MKARTVRLPDGRVWLRAANPDWTDPLDPSHAAERGGRWNPPDSYPTLYLNGDVGTARAQIERMLTGSPVRIDDLDDDAYVLVAATLPASQVCANATTPAGLRALDLPGSYPLDSAGVVLPVAVCQPVGLHVKSAGLRGVWCRSASMSDGTGRELAWFPAGARSRARRVWRKALPLGRWRHATSWADIGLDEQRDPD